MLVGDLIARFFRSRANFKPKYMVEVFKTDVTNNDEAKKLIDFIHFGFNHYQANFDLDDFDRILMIKCESEPIKTNLILLIFNQYGFNTEVLVDDFEMEI